MIVFFLLVIAIIAGYWVITNIIDAILLGRLLFRNTDQCVPKQYFTVAANRIDIQTGFQCSAFASAYVLRSFGIEVDGAVLYASMPHKMKSGYVYPKGIRELLRSYGMSVKYCRGNLDTLQEDLQKGHPVIVMIRVQKHQPWLHYVPVVGYNEKQIFLAESLPELVNCEGVSYNRIINKEDFLQLWNTATIWQPLYKNTYFLIHSKLFRLEGCYGRVI